MKLRKIAAFAISTVMCAFTFAGCGAGSPAPTATSAQETTAAAETTEATTTEETTAAAPETTAAPAAEPTEDDTSADKPVILTVSFGTSYNDSREKTIGAIEAAIQAANPDYEVRRAFTSQIIIDKLKERDNIVIDNVDEAFARLIADGVKDLTVQPTHVMSGFEYDDLMEVVKANADKFDSVKVGSPLLTSDDDYKNVVEAITAATAEYDDGETAIVFMGHGTEHPANATYAKLQTMLADAGKKNYCIGTVEAEPSIEDVIEFAKNGGYKRIVLEPLMVVAGDHANNDMAGDEEDSWKTILTNEGFEVVPVLRGLGEIEAVQKIYVDHVKNAKPLGSDKPVILTVSFGTSYNDSREKTIGAIEAAIQAANPDYEVRRAFTSQIIIDKLKERDNIVIDNVDEAFARLIADGVKDLTVQPTHVMSGFEYDDLMEVVKANADKFDSVKVGSPLLTSDDDYKNVVEAITAATAEYDDGETAIVFMGHGTEHPANATYAKLQSMLTDAGKKNYCIGTVEAEPSIEDVIEFAKNGGYKRIVLEPLMVVAGDHANNDMAGDEEDSWKTILTNEGFEVVPVLRGLGEIEAVQKIYVDHVKNAAELSGAALADGEYTITAETDASMFKIVDCRLTVADGEMTAVITLSGSGFNYIYMGTAADAENAAESDLIAFTENDEGKHVYTIPVEALDKPIKCAAQSLKKGTWYDHEIIFKSESIA